MEYYIAKKGMRGALCGDTKRFPRYIDVYKRV
jgi:hypothetical protein